jgi:hypothetical protein
VVGCFKMLRCFAARLMNSAMVSTSDGVFVIKGDILYNLS